MPLVPGASHERRAFNGVPREGAGGVARESTAKRIKDLFSYLSASMRETPVVSKTHILGIQHLGSSTVSPLARARWPSHGDRSRPSVWTRSSVSGTTSRKPSLVSKRRIS